MNKRMKIVLLGLMIWIITFMAGFFIFVIFDTEAGDLGVWTWISGIKEFSITIGLTLGLFLVFREKGQDYKRTAREAGIAWYVILLVMDLIVLVGFLGLQVELWFPSIFTYSTVAIIPIVVGYLLAGSREKV